MQNLGDEDSEFSDSQRVLEQLKQHIPIYHTRFMGKEVFRKFGRQTSLVKPASMRAIYRSLTGIYMYLIH